MMQERGVFVDPSSINRWSIRFLPALEKVFRKHKRPVGVSWRMDETYIKVKGIWKYLYRAVDKEGVACFIGSPAMNFVDAKVQASAAGVVVDTGWARIPVPTDLNLQGMDSVVVGVRPEHIAIDGNGSIGDNVSFQARIEVIEHLGAEVILEVAAGNQILTISGVNPYLQLNVDDTLNCSFATDKTFFFNTKIEEAIYA